MKLLNVDSSVLGDASVSRALSASIVAREQALHPDLEIVRRDLVATPVPHMSPAFVAATRGPGASQPMPPELAPDVAILDEFLAADIVVIGAPMYNFGIASQLKAWLDRLGVPGKTFRYSASGPEGLAGGKRVIVASARGGKYGADTPYAAFDHQETYLRALFQFIGVTDLTFIRAEGVAMGPDVRDAAIAAANEDIAELAA